MGYFWATFLGACGVLIVVVGLLMRNRARRAIGRAELSVDDDAVRRIIEEGVLELAEDEPLDLDEIEEEERRFWEQTWDEAEEW